MPVRKTGSKLKKGYFSEGSFPRPTLDLVILTSELGFLPAEADPVLTVLLTHKHKKVEQIAFNDGTTACYAQVDATSDRFTVWGC
jgi:hypothetical protein